MLTEILFKNKKPNERYLLDHGFVNERGFYAHSFNLLDGQFEMTVRISGEGKVTERVEDIATGEEYVLHRMPDACGAFVGRVRKEYEDVLRSISEECFESDIFKSNQSNAVIAYVREKYGCELEYLWERFSDNAVWRCRDNAKWFGALLTVSKNKLGLVGNERTEIIDLRIDPEELEKITDGKKYFPGYHMNKKHWITICLDGSVPTEEIFDRIDDSYLLAAKLKKRSKNGKGH